jgi:hypothetical protein
VGCADGSTSQTTINYNQGSGSSSLLASNEPRTHDAVSNKNHRDYRDYAGISGLTTDGLNEIPMTGATPSRKIANGLQLSPNPTNGIFTIDLPDAGFEQLQITTLAGRVVKQIPLEENSVSQKVDCLDLPNGLYFLSVKGQERMLTQKFVKN